MSNLTPQETAESLEYQAAHTISMPDKDRAALEQAATYIRKIANGELRPVIHAHWIEIDDCNNIWKCSHCGLVRHIPPEIDMFQCPKCRAVMDGTEDTNAK